MLLGVSVGVTCNTAFPEWLVTLLLVIFLASSFIMICKKGLKLWKTESEEINRNSGNNEESGNDKFEEPHHLGNNEISRLKLPRLKLGFLLLVWLSFFAIYFLRGSRNGQVRNLFLFLFLLSV
ncbi:hypothetical protein K1719_002206 [Acacia pycnantha]|nr:hypothetical protein K1719_002206 [Acacia pycnantha]